MYADGGYGSAKEGSTGRGQGERDHHGGHGVTQLQEHKPEKTDVVRPLWKIDMGALQPGAKVWRVWNQNPPQMSPLRL